MTRVYKSDITSSNPNLKPLKKDQLLDGINNADIYLFDLSSTLSFPSQVAPVNNGVVYDLADNADSTILAPSAVGFVGRGFVFDKAYASKTGVQLPSIASSRLYAQENFLICAYIKMPTAAKWGLPSGATLPIVGMGGTNESPNPFVLALVTDASGNKQLWGRRKLDGTNWSDRQISINSLHLGQVCQIAIWRTGSEYGVRVKSVAGGLQQSSSSSGNAKTTVDFTSGRLTFGIPNAVGTGYTGYEFSQYRGFVENLALTLRNPSDVLDDDFDRVMARNKFS